MTDKAIQWGIIGCGDVTEVKSGPAFSKVPGSKLVAVMRRDAAKAADYAQRHGVPAWYDDAALLLADPAVNAIYVATPPSTHAHYTNLAIDAGKPVYVEKPMALDAGQAEEMTDYALEKNVPLVVAHYRRAQPLYLEIKQLLDAGAIGRPAVINLRLHKPQRTHSSNTSVPWRLDPAISGGGLFHDLAPHQLDIIYWLFGKATQVSGFALNHSGTTDADDLVTAQMMLEKDIIFNGEWNFTNTIMPNIDRCEIIGDKGSISFSFFDHQPIELSRNGKIDQLHFEKLPHVQEPMIAKVVNYFLGKGENPCTGADGMYVMQLIDEITLKKTSL